MVKKIRNDFPALNQMINGHPLIYVDNASTTQNPMAVTDRLVKFYTTEYGNIYRGIYAVGEHATKLYEQARNTVASYIGAHEDEVIFTQGTTEGINFIATAWGMNHLKAGDEIVLTELEHHANLIPWQQVARATGVTLKFISVRADGTLNLDHLDTLITKKTKFVGCVHISNALGTTNDIQTIIRAARAVGAPILIDAAQSAPHIPLDVHAFDCDFLVFSGHKMCGPTGIGVLYIARRMFDTVPPYQFGGGMLSHATYQTATWLKSPHRYEAGTPPIAQAIGLAAAIEYLKKNVDFKELHRHEASLCAQLIEGLSLMDHIQILGPIEQLKKEGHLVSFVVQGMHAHDAAAYLDTYGIAVRAGHFCAQPLFAKLGIEAALRVSFYCYNTPFEVEKIVSVLGSLPRL
ncbi:MAG: SufS family cysteine desulfurase [Candidatus Babeliales bacterium]